MISVKTRTSTEREVLPGMPNMTIKDIARLSGCSVSTISRVINDRPDVRPETKKRCFR